MTRMTFMADDGDKSVGIGESRVTLDVNYDLLSQYAEPEAMREAIRKAFVAFCRDALDVPKHITSGARYDDECEDCWSVIDASKPNAGHHASCPSSPDAYAQEQERVRVIEEDGGDHD